MLKETRNLYERLGKKAKLPAKALEILHSKQLKTPYKGVSYTIGHIYAVLNDKYDDRQVESAIIQAAKDYIDNEKREEGSIKDLLAEIAA